jgi:hypothetical protein
MIIEEEVLESSAAVNAESRRPNRRRPVVIGVAILAVAVAALFTVIVGPDASGSRDVPRTTVEPTAPDAVNEQAPVLDDETLNTRTGRQPGRTRDDIIRDLVRRGLVPAATLSDGTQITRPGLAGRRSG